MLDLDWLGLFDNGRNTQMLQYLALISKFTERAPSTEEARELLSDIPAFLDLLNKEHPLFHVTLDAIVQSFTAVPALHHPEAVRQQVRYHAGNRYGALAELDHAAGQLTRHLLPSLTLPELFDDFLQTSNLTPLFVVAIQERLTWLSTYRPDEVREYVRRLPESEYSTHDLHDVYRAVLRAKLPRVVTQHFSQVCAERGVELPYDLLGHAFPDYPDGDPRVLDLAASDYEGHFGRANFLNCYESLVVIPHRHALGHVSARLVGLLDDEETMWYFVMKHKDNATWLLKLIETYTPGAAFSRADIGERAALNRRSKTYLNNLFVRALALGEMRDTLLDYTDSTNVTSLLLDLIKVTTDENWETLKETAPALAAIAAARRFKG